MNNTESLVQSIKTLKENSDYRITDVIYKKGFRWKHSTEMVLSNPKYDNTILREYLLKNSNKSVNLNTLYNCISNHSTKNNSLVPAQDELVVHLRMGDVVSINNFSSRHSGYLNKLKRIIKNSLNKIVINKLTIVTCFAYQVWSEDSIHLKPANVPTYSYSDKDQDMNIQLMTGIFDSLSEFDFELGVQSSTDPDDDLIYCTFANHFIQDIRNIGGFSKLLSDLNNINRTK